jgi:hypothetical protein
MAYEDVPIEFLDEEEFDQEAYDRRYLRRRRVGRRLGIVSAFAAVTFGLAASPKAMAPAPVPRPFLPGTNAPILADRGSTSYGVHELAEILCSYKKMPDASLIPSGPDPTNPFAIELGHPSLKNFAIVYAGGGDTGIVALQHITVQQKGGRLTISSDKPEMPGYAAEVVLSRQVNLAEGEAVTGETGIIWYQVRRLSGHVVVAVACDQSGTDEIMSKTFPGMVVDPWRLPEVLPNT